MSTVSKIRFTSNYNVPSNPAPLTEVEQALDMMSQSSARTIDTSLFVPQQPISTLFVIPTVDTFAQPIGVGTLAPSAITLSGLLNQPQTDAESATADIVQGLGLPCF